MSKYKDDILELRSQGLTYDEITEALGCAKSTVSYYCGTEQRKKRRDRQRDRRNHKRRVVEELKTEAKCADCKVDYPAYVMDFDHVQGEKVGDVTSLVQFGSLEDLFKEIDKCEIVCANCHRERTYRRLKKEGTAEVAN